MKIRCDNCIYGLCNLDKNHPCYSCNIDGLAYVNFVSESKFFNREIIVKKDKKYIIGVLNIDNTTSKTVFTKNKHIHKISDVNDMNDYVSLKAFLKLKNRVMDIGNNIVKQIPNIFGVDDMYLKLQENERKIK